MLPLPVSGKGTPTESEKDEDRGGEGQEDPEKEFKNDSGEFNKMNVAPKDHESKEKKLINSADIYIRKRF